MKNDIFKKDYIFLDVDCNEKIEALKYISSKCVDLEISNNSEKVYEGLLKREEEFTTNLGYFISIPHIKTKYILSPSVFLVKFKNSINWSEGEEEVKMCLSLLIPEDKNTHLKLLSKLSRKLINKEFISDLLNNNNVDELFEIINNCLNI